MALRWLFRAWCAAVLVFLDDVKRDPAALPGPELDGLFGEHPRETLLGIIGHPAPLGLTSLYDNTAGVLTITDDLGAPNLAALPVLLLWLYPEKLPLAYSVHVTDNPDLAVWTIVSLQRIEITQTNGDKPRAQYIEGQGVELQNMLQEQVKAGPFGIITVEELANDGGLRVNIGSIFSFTLPQANAMIIR